MTEREANFSFSSGLNICTSSTRAVNVLIKRHTQGGKKGIEEVGVIYTWGEASRSVHRIDPDAAAQNHTEYHLDDLREETKTTFLIKQSI
ncbi:hypothetical protein GDO78_003839 [Eleutherodactylus coqui]|uniref:Uncharacterized protein n=1 Tax=Eleutherodactylus coqui TaxID=57060 RepID=A0A8J6EUN1_ELECQ|nr:hypothetical protein GDO78_003839 [Eleutherodactylus coqui]